MKPVGSAVASGLFVLIALAFATAPVSASGTDCRHESVCNMAASSPDGDRVYFVVGEPLVKDDQNEAADIYERSGSRVRLITRSTKGTGGRSGIAIGYASQKRNLPHLVFSTLSSFSPQDKDRENDIYETRNGKVRLLTPDVIFRNSCRSSKCKIRLAGYDAGTSTLFVQAKGRLSGDDNDSSFDLFSIKGSNVTLLSGGPRDGGADSRSVWAGSIPARIQADGKFYFQTDEPLVDADTDRLVDLYASSGGGTVLVSDWPGGGSEAYGRFEVAFSKAVPGRLYLTARELWFVAQPPEGENATTVYLVDPGQLPQTVVSGDFENGYAGESPDGSTAYFTTREKLDPLDLDETVDLYAWREGNASLFSTGPRNAPRDPGSEEPGSRGLVHVSAGGAVYFLSDEQLVAADSDETTDLYLRDGDSVELVSSDLEGRGGDGNIEQVRILDDGERILLTTEEAMVAADQDESNDLYLKTAQKLILLSGLADGDDSNYGPLEGPAPVQELAGGRYLFVTNGRLNNEDGDNGWDAYMFNPKRPSKPGLVSKGNLAIYRGPAGTVAQGPARFWFRQTGPQTRFVCRLDERDWRACKSPVTYSELNDWSHTLEVASVGKNGNGKDAAVSRRFSLDPGAVFTYRWLGDLQVNPGGDRVLLSTTTRKAERRTNRILMVGPEGSETIYSGPGDAEVIEADEGLSNVAFRTRKRLSPADDDAQPDIYLGHREGRPLLFPMGRNLIDEPVLSNLNYNGNVGASFFTRDQLSPSDSDQAVDAYLAGPANSGEITLASGGTESSLDARPFKVPRLDKAVAFYTREKLVPEDTDDGFSLYWGDGETIRYVTSAQVDYNVYTFVTDPKPVSGSSNGRSFLFTSNLQLLPADTDGYTDVYRWSASSGLNLESQFQEDSKARVPALSAVPGRRAVTRSGDEFLMLTNDTRLPWDSGNTSRIHRVRDGVINVISDPSSFEMGFRGSSANLKSVVVTSWDPMVEGDDNDRPDLFLDRNGITTRLTDTPEDSQTFDPADFRMIWASDDGEQVAFTTSHRLADLDKDRYRDLYLWKEGNLLLLSKTRKLKGDFNLGTVVTGESGGKYYFRTRFALLRGDRNKETDLYQVSVHGLKRFNLWPNL